ncbi:hypothetical protein I316_07866 [Kwoniella heveanensis BCC8398]|uniref:Trafficking protein particle complex subunit n=1 Tax=Kwoniella heveanensis BCC8398 TaxID=1296120 RepID=A0A1B9GHE1_9TREE|nr:hypothetical protein I316_07866 [Kwoniella heveanensis BCC8398]
MTIYSLYIFDRHCECVYYQDWHRTRPARSPPSTTFKPGVHRLPPPQSNTTNDGTQQRESIFANPNPNTSVNGGDHNNRNSLVSTNNGRSGEKGGGGVGGGGANKGLPFDEEAKLVYGVILSLRNMVKKLSGREEAFTSYSTGTYKLHLFETLTNYKFVLLSDPSSDSLRFVLRQLYVGPFLEYVVRNPLVDVDSRDRGVDNDLVSCVAE